MDDLDMGRNQAGKKKGKKKILLLLILILLMAGGGGGYWYWDTNMNQPAPMPMPRKATTARKSDAKKPKAAEVQVEKQGAPSVPEYGNLQEYARLEAEADLLRKKKEVITLQQDINKIEGTDVKKGSGKGDLSAQDIQDLISKEVGRQMPGMQAAAKVPPVDQIPVVFISVEGVGNNIVAKVRELNGIPVTLKIGSSFRGGKVTGISRNGIIVKINGKRIFYPFQS